MKNTNNKKKIWIAGIAVVALLAGAAAWMLACRGGADGMYSGVVPCADCEGIRTSVKIDGDEYVMTTEYLGKGGDIFVDVGRVERPKRGVIAVGSREATYYKVEKDGLLQLDREMNPIESSFNYKLSRI